MCNYFQIAHFSVITHLFNQSEAHISNLTNHIIRPALATIISKMATVVTVKGPEC